MKNVVTIFCREPILGKVKTRLAADLGEDISLEIYKNLLTGTINLVSKLPCSSILFIADPIVNPTNISWASGLQIKIQAEGNLGHRMSAVFMEYCNNDRKVILIGSDCPGIQTHHLEEAMNSLDDFDIVIGPSLDGGYYLIGMKKYYFNLFLDISWSTPQVLQQTLSKAKTDNLRVYLLPVLIDIDTADDLKITGFKY